MTILNNKIASYCILVLITGPFFMVLAISAGHLISRILKLKETSWDNYGWRAVGAVSLLWGCLFTLMVIVSPFTHVSDINFGGLYMIILIGIIPAYVGKKLLFNWTNIKINPSIEKVNKVID